MTQETVKNPIIPLDYPDPDVIRVGDTYYMVSTTMYFIPGCEILRSYDLVNWEHACFVYDKLDSTKAQRLEESENIYGKGMWAASLRYHNNQFYVVFAANDTQKTYLYRTASLEEKWTKTEIKGFYHDSSLFFDDDDKVYIVYGNRQIWLTELEEDLSGPKEGGLHRIIVSEEGNQRLAYEGAHFYKINGHYYVFLIHSLPHEWKRTQACFMSHSLMGTFTGGDIVNDDIDYHNQGVAQGGIVDTPEGNWYAVLFQDRGAVGRLPVLTPLNWQDKFPVIGNNKTIPREFDVPNPKPDYEYASLYGGDDFKNKTAHLHGLQSYWQFNHEPDLNGFKVDFAAGYVQMMNTSVQQTFTQARNMLTQRMLFPYSAVEVTIDATGLNNGDIAGIAALQYQYGFIGVTKEDDIYSLIVQTTHKETDNLALLNTLPDITISDPSCITFRVEARFDNQVDSIRFFYKGSQIGPDHHVAFDLEHFTGCRYALFNWATKEINGSVRFSQFKYLT